MLAITLGEHFFVKQAFYLVMELPYKVGIIFGLVFLLQVWATRNFQSLPPEESK